MRICSDNASQWSTSWPSFHDVTYGQQAQWIGTMSSQEELTQEVVCSEAWRHRSALTAFAYSWLKDWSRADDVVQEAFIVVLNKWQDVRNLDGIHAWTRKIVRFKIMEARRANKREISAEQEALEALAVKSVEEQLDNAHEDIQNMRAKALQECFEKVDPKKQALFNGYYLEQKNCDQLAEGQRISSNGIAQILSRLRKSLRKCAEKRLGLGGEASS